MNRQAMIETLDAAMSGDREQFRETGRYAYKRNPLKSYLVEANVPGAGEDRDVIQTFLTSEDIGTPVNVRPTDDQTLNVLLVGSGGIEFWLDTLDERYWVLHTRATASDADGAIRGLVNNSRLLDSIWLPTRFFERAISSLGIAKVVTSKFAVRTGLYQESLPEDLYKDESLVMRFGSAGNAMTRWQSYRRNEALQPSLALWGAQIVRRPDGDEDGIVAIDDLTASGKITARGNSFPVHQEFITTLKNLYATLITGWETTYRLDWKQDDGRLVPTGATAVIPFPEELVEEELVRLAGSMFDGGEPYRLYGVPQRQGSSRLVVRAIDLHTGHKINFELTSRFIRAYLFPNTCGNVLARLVTNLQHFKDARIELDGSADA